MRKTVLLLAALLILQPPEAEAFFGFNPCRSCRGFLKFCCPRPCPVRDTVHRANQDRIRQTNVRIDAYLTDSREIVTELSHTVGQPAPDGTILVPHPAPTRPAGTPPFAAGVSTGPSVPSAPSPSRAHSMLQPRAASTRGQALEFLHANAILDASQALQTLSWALARSEETAAAADDPVPHAQNLRLMLARNLQMQNALTQITAAISAARSFRVRLNAQRPLQTPATAPPQDTLPPTFPR